jgi:small subunit ribosomal protein S4
MARHTLSVCKLCRREGVKLYLKGERCFKDKCAVERRKTPPGQHGKRRTKLTKYGVQLREKQKVKRIYGLLERQFRVYFDRASQMKGKTGEQLLGMLEKRMDNVIFRMGLAPSRAMARQLVVHGHVLLNGRRIDLPSAQVSAGDEIALAASLKENGHVKASFETARGRGVVPEWLTVDTGMMAARVAREPARNDISYPITEQLIVELYSK